MKEYDGKKLRSLALVIVLLISTIAVVNFVANVDKVRADGAGGKYWCDGYGNVTGTIHITAPADGNAQSYKRGKAVTITWSSTANNHSSYSIAISRYSFVTENYAVIYRASGLANTTTSHTWRTNASTICGEYRISVSAFNVTADYTKVAENNNVSIYITHGIPGYNAYQGGNESLARNGDEILNSAGCSIWPLVYHPTNTVDIAVNSSQNWTGYTYYLWKPQYNGTSDGGTYEFGWWSGRVASSYETVAQVNATSGDYIFDDIVLDRAGLWIIDIREDNPSNPNYAVTDADFSTYALRNSTVAGWFWVNASSGITLAVDDQEFVYNSSGYLTLTVTNQVAVDEDSAIVDIRYNINGTSIYDYNIPTGDGGILNNADSRYYLKNNSFSAQASNYRKYGFWGAGNYTAYAYIDMDTWTSGYYNKYRSNNMANTSAGNQHWNSTFGANAQLNGEDTTVFPSARYNWSQAGPYDPPEYEAATKSIVVQTATPYTSVGNSTQHYGFEGEVNITIRESLGGSKFLESRKIFTKVYNPDDTLVNEHVLITNDTASSQGFITIYSATWGKDGGAYIGGNGTWKAVIYIDENNDRDAGYNDVTPYTEEWNTTVYFTLSRAGSITFDFIDDDGVVDGVDNWGFKNTKTDQIIPYIPDRHNVPLDIQFKIRGADGSPFGDYNTPGEYQSGLCRTTKECAENISISGNSLFTGTLDKFPGYVDTWTTNNQTGYASDIWHVAIIPTMGVGGGTITISYTAYNSSGQATISIGGDEYAKNGSIVTALNQDGSSSFQIDVVNQTLTITAKTGANEAIPFHWANLYYLNDRGALGLNAATVAPRVERAYLGGSGSGTMNFNRTMQTTNQTLVDFDSDGSVADTQKRAPRNLTIYVDGPGRMDGYALLKMDRSANLEVEIYPTTMLAGYKYSKFYINCTMAGNSTATPNESTTDKAQFYVKIIDSSGNDVTTSIIRCIDQTSDLQAGSSHTTSAKPYSFTFNSNIYGIAPDTYTFYCYNNTHHSQGYNATLTIDQVNVDHSFADGSTGPLIWNYDDNISITFTITYNGVPIDGTLRIDNMTYKGTAAYNRTWSLTNFTSTLTSTGSDQENLSITISEDAMDNGVVTVHDISASHLDTGVHVRNITYWFMPASPYDGSYARAVGRLPVQVPTVTPTPQYIPLGQTSKITLKTTGRGIALPSIFVGLNGRGISIADTNGTTGADGTLQLSVTPASTGNMDIHVGEDGRIVETKVVVTSWELAIDAPVKANEGSDITVTITEVSSGDAVEGASVTLSGVGSVTTDANGIALFTDALAAPEVTSDIAYTLTATKEGYVSDTATITIVNIPKLTLTVKYPNEKGKGTTSGICVEQTFTVTVSKDDANPAVNALVTLQGDSTVYYTDGNGQVTITAPSTAGDYTVTATFGAFLEGTVTVSVLAKDNDNCKTPGFELLTLIVAIGVAFILLRRRRQ